MKAIKNYGLPESLIDAVKKAVEEAKKPLVGNQKKLDVDKDGDIEADDLKDLRSGKAKKEVVDMKPKMESVEKVEEGIEDKLAMAKLMAASRGKSTAKKTSDDKSKARFVSGKQYGGSKQADDSDDEEEDDKPKKSMKGVAKGVFKRRFNTKTFKNKIAKEEVEKLDEKTPSKQEVKQAIGIARDKRYAGGNMTGAVKAMDKVNKGLAQHPAVAKELQKQNEEVEQIDELETKTLKSYIKKNIQTGRANTEKGDQGLYTASKKVASKTSTSALDKKVKALSAKSSSQQTNPHEYETSRSELKKRNIYHFGGKRINRNEEVESVEERTLTEPEMKKREEVVKSMKKKLAGFKERYGSRAKEVMYATATKIAKGNK